MKKIEAFDGGYAFTATDFKEIADTAPTNKALSRLSEAAVFYKNELVPVLNDELILKLGAGRWLK